MFSCNDATIGSPDSSNIIHKQSKTSKKCKCIEELSLTIAKLRRMDMDLEQWEVVANKEFEWSKLFVTFILDTISCQGEKCLAHADDMIWYVNKAGFAESFYSSGKITVPKIEVFRRHSKNQPTIADKSYSWEETVCLNLILQQLDFFVTCAVCTKTSPSNLQIIKKICKPVFPSPSRRRMDSKGDCEEITYPKLYFAIDGFEEVFNDIIIRDGECVCVELVARDRQHFRQAVIFLGSIRYGILQQVYETKASSKWNWTPRWGKSDRRQEFVRMRGPHGKGHAEMAVSPLSDGPTTPLTERALDTVNLSKSMGRRRMSETNLNASMTSSVTLSKNPKWQSESDNIEKCTEVDGQNLDDDLDHLLTSPFWTARGVGQAWHWLREKKKAGCAPLHALLTYVTLPWTSILEDFLTNHPRAPILTFDLDSVTENKI